MAEKEKPKAKGGALAATFGSDDDDAPPAAGSSGALPADDGDADGESEGSDDPFEQACDEAFQAVKDNDKAAFCEALKAAIDIHITTTGGPTPTPGA